MWLQQAYAGDETLVNGLEFFEEYDPNGVMLSRQLLEIKFRLIGKTEFEALVKSVGFKITELYGDYSYSTFDIATSPFMIYALEK